MADTPVDHVKEAADEAESAADELQERGEKVGADIEHAKKRWDEVQSSQSIPSASGDWEDSEPDDSTGEDPSGFDDPEELDLDDDELADDDVPSGDEESP